MCRRFAAPLVAVVLVAAVGVPLTVTFGPELTGDAAVTAEAGDSAATGAAATPDQLVGSDTPRDPGAADAARPTDPVPGAVGTSAGPRRADATQEAGIRVVHAVERVPDDPGAVEVRAVAHLPDSVTRFEMSPHAGGTVLDTTGFEPGGEQETYRWDEDTVQPSITYRVGVNRTTDFATYDSVDTGEWAMVDHGTVDASFYYWYRGSDPGWSEPVEVADGEAGYAGAAFTFLGDHEVRTDDSGALAVRLVVPDSVEMAADTDRAVGTLNHAAGSLAVGDAPETLTVFVVPEPMNRGVTPGSDASEFFVRADVGVAGSESTWTHEYVHTRQRYRPDASMAWLDEGSAEYYGYLLSMRAGTTPYSVFRNAVTGDSYAGADLRKPGAWSDPAVEYEKGARVVAALDARIRAETGGNVTFQTVFRRLNSHEGTVTYEEFKDILRELTGVRFGAYVDSIVTTDGDTAVARDPFRYATDETADYDGDDLVTAAERAAGTNPFVADTDGDDLGDGREGDLVTNATLADTDGDGLDDGREVERGTDPTAVDTDEDGLDDGREVELGTDPTAADTDDDGVDDGREAELGTDLTGADTDEDELDDGAELDRGTGPTVADTDGDGRDDGREVELGTDPTEPDADTATGTRDDSGGTDAADGGNGSLGGQSDGTASADGADDGDAGGESDGDAATAEDGPTPLPAVLALAVVCGLGRRLLGRQG